jgi:hypothetical protein
MPDTPKSGRTREYPCPECGFDGPHTTCEVDEGGVTYECGSCYVEFYAPDSPEKAEQEVKP